MTLTLTLEDEMQDKLQILAEQKGINAQDFVRALLSDFLEQQQLKSFHDEELLQKIDLGFSEEQWHRYYYLISLQHSEALNESQYQELLAFIERLEEANAKRMAVLAEIAKRRQQPLQKVMADLGIKSPPIL
ncbi:MAG: hypothetical protein R2880_13975 [Deinococcales bacterium]